MLPEANGDMAAAACLPVSLRRFGGDGTAATGIATGGGAASDSSMASSLSEVVDMFSPGSAASDASSSAEVPCSLSSPPSEKRSG